MALAVLAGVTAMRAAAGWAGETDLSARTDVRSEYRDDAREGASREGSGRLSVGSDLSVRRRGDAMETAGTGRVEWWTGTLGEAWLNASSRVSVLRESERGRAEMYGLLRRETTPGLQVDASGLVFSRLEQTTAGAGLSGRRAITERVEGDLTYGFAVTRSNTVGVSDVTTHDVRATGTWSVSEAHVVDGSLFWTSLRSDQPGGTDSLSVQYHHVYRMTERMRAEGALGGNLALVRATDATPGTRDAGVIGRAALTRDLSRGNVSLTTSQSVLPSQLGVLVRTRQAGAQTRLAVSEFLSGGLAADLYHSQPVQADRASRSTAFRAASDLRWTITPDLTLAASYVYLQSHETGRRSRSHSVVIGITRAWERHE
jgi:hypothetical protein